MVDKSLQQELQDLIAENKACREELHKKECRILELERQVEPDRGPKKGMDVIEELKEQESRIMDLEDQLESQKYQFSLLEYQQKAKMTAIYPTIGHSVIYPALGLANETGELLGKLKKVFRDKSGDFTDSKKEIRSEIGDVLWYLSQVCTELNISLEGVAVENLDKLKDRMDRGAIKGDGDNR